MSEQTDTDLIKAARQLSDATTAEANRLHERSCTLNSILYRLAVASGMAEVGAQRTREIDTEVLLRRVETLLAGTGHCDCACHRLGSALIAADCKCGRAVSDGS